MQVELLNTVPIGTLMAEPIAAHERTDGGFQDALDGARDVTERPNDNEEAGSDSPDSEVSDSQGEETDTSAEQKPVGESTTTDAEAPEVVFTPVTNAQPTTVGASLAVTATTVMPETMGEVPPSALPGGVALGPATAATSSEANQVAAPAAISTGEATQPTLPTSPEQMLDAEAQPTGDANTARGAALATSAQAPRPNPEIVRKGTLQTAELTTETPVGDYAVTEAGGSAVATERDHSFFLLQPGGGQPMAAAGAATSAPIPEQLASTQATSDPVSAFVQESAPQVRPEPTGPTTSTSTSPTAVDGVTAVERADNALRATPVLRAEAGEEAGLTRRIYRLVRRAIRNGDSEVRIRLDPPNLGRVDIQVKMQGDRVDVVFQVDDEQVRSAVVKSLEDLERALKDYGYHTQEVTVDLRNESGGDSQQASSERQGESEDSGETSIEDPVRQEVHLDHLGAAMDLRG